MKKWLPLLVVFYFLITPRQASAHAFGKLYNLPVPFWLYAYGAAAAVIASFIIIGFFLSQKKEKDYPVFNISKFSFVRFFQSKIVIIIFQIVSVFLFLLVIISGIIGQNDPYSNLNMTLFWIFFVLGTTYITGILGDIYKILSPFNFFMKIFLKEDERMMKYPEGLSYLPAFIFYFIFIWIELIAQAGPFELSLILIFYFLINIAGAILFGRQDWLKYGEFFSVFFRLISKISLFEYKDKKLYLRFPFIGALKSKAVKSFSLLLFILFMLSSTAFDGFRETTPWYRFYWGYLDGFIRPILGDISYPAVNTLALFLSPFFFLAIYLFLIFISKKLTNISDSVISLAYKFAYTLIPIAFVYNIAHYYTLLITQGQEAMRLISDPFGFGWNLFGTSNISNNFIPDANFIWHSQVAVLLIGHIAGVFLSHEIALSVFPTQKKALLSQIPMLLLMVTYTVIGLWILSQPLTGI